MRRWRDAMREALYGPEGFYTAASSGGPAAHFRTSAHVSTVFAGALTRLVARVDEALGQPNPFELVDVGAGRGELLLALLAELPRPLAARVRATAVEVGPPPSNLPPGIAWTDRPPPKTTGLLLATEWLDNVPVDVACRDAPGAYLRALARASVSAELTDPDGLGAHTWLLQPVGLESHTLGMTDGHTGR